MPRHHHIINKLNVFLQSLPKSFQVMETPVDIDVQLEYYQAARKAGKPKQPPAPDEIRQWQRLLEDQDVSLEEKKDALVTLAAFELPESYRVIEAYAKNPDPRLKAWSTMALQESKMILESSLLDEGQVYISTGLGGKGANLRYFIVIQHKEGPLAEFQKKVMANELEDALKQNQGELEELRHYDMVSTLLMLLPVQCDLTQILLHAIQESNQYGDFLETEFLITNMRVLNEQEIMQMIAHNKAHASHRSV